MRKNKQTAQFQIVGDTTGTYRFLTGFYGLGDRVSKRHDGFTFKRNSIHKLLH